ncbi:unnamed protein product [Linum trigynum]|uniref:Uncharacterized protein n=1 Tax=Linum trigynum TaxID=586398 RepID=A0AAV2FC67_9ROSI
MAAAVAASPYPTATVAVKPFGTADFFFSRSAPRRQHLKARLRAQCRFPAGQDDDHDEWPKDAVEANLSVLRERIAALRMKERQRQMEDRSDVNIRHFPGQFPAAVKRRRRREDGEGNVIMGVVAVVSSTLGLTWLAGTGLLCVVSFLSHHFGHPF